MPSPGVSLRTTLRFVRSRSERAQALALRADIRELDRQKGGPEGEVDTVLDGRTLCCYSGMRMLGTMDVHWGRDGIDPRKLSRFNVDSVTRGAPPELVLVLDPPMVHPAFSDEPVHLELKEAAARFAVRVGARFVFSTTPYYDLQIHQSLGFRTIHGGTAQQTRGRGVPIVLDVTDLGHLRRKHSPLVEVVERALARDATTERIVTATSTKAVAPRSEAPRSEAPKAEAPARQPAPAKPAPQGPAQTPDAAPAPRRSMTPAFAEAEQTEDQLDATAVWRQIYKLQRQARISGQEFLSTISARDVGGVLMGGAILRPEEGSKIISQGERGRDLFLVLQGVVTVLRDGRVLAQHTGGTVLGEVGFVLDVERSADVVAASADVQVLKIGAEHLDRLLEEDPRLAAQVLYGLNKALCRKLAAVPPA